jgi:hypothetical protein
MHLYLPICIYLGLNAKVSATSNAANIAAYGGVFVYVTRNTVISGSHCALIKHVTQLKEP